MNPEREPLLLVSMNVQGAASGHEIPAGMLPRLLDSAYRAKRKKAACLDLLITGDGEMAKMNRRHLGKNNPTDVLAFEDGEDEDGRLRLGDVAVNADMASRAPGERDVPFEQELAFYALHGLFHLLGMDDADDADRALMHRAQARAMRDFGMTVPENLL